MPAEIRRQLMGVEEYKLLPFHPGWKVEYDGHYAVYRPREALAYGVVPVASRTACEVEGVVIRSPDETDGADLSALFREAFANSPEYAGWPEARFH